MSLLAQIQVIKHCDFAWYFILMEQQVITQSVCDGRVRWAVNFEKWKPNAEEWTRTLQLLEDVERERIGK